MPNRNIQDNLRSRKARDLDAERDALGGWVREPEVSTLDARVLGLAGVEAAVVGKFGLSVDKSLLEQDRLPVPEPQLRAQGSLDYSSCDELWLDYVGDTGAGWSATQTMAWVLAQPAVHVDSESLPRANVLVLGGDHVFPSAGSEAYQHRLVGPFQSAFPRAEVGNVPDIYATAGWQDRVDGLTTFLRVFCVSGWIGGWRTRQRRSYFALQLPNRWWLWAADIQVDNWLDDTQLDYFNSQMLQPGDKVILLTARPSWLAAIHGRVEPRSWRFLSFFEERMIRDRDARLVMTIAAEQHHYARYEPEGDLADMTPTRITAGGGGAALSPTHTLPKELLLKPLSRRSGEGFEDTAATTIRQAQVYPDADVSRRLSAGILRLPRLNPRLARVHGGLYAVLGVTMLGVMVPARGPLFDQGTTGDYFGFFAAGFGGLSLVVLLFRAITSAAEFEPRPGNSQGAIRAARYPFAVIQTVAHLAPIGALAWIAVGVGQGSTGDPAPRLALFLGPICLMVMFLLGKYYGTMITAFAMYMIHRLRGGCAPVTAHLVFEGQSIIDYKSFLRMRFDADGGLTVYPIGVDRVTTRWALKDDPDGVATGFAPRSDDLPAVKLIEQPIGFSGDGARL